MNLFAVLRRTPEDDPLPQPSDEELLAWTEELRTGRKPPRRRQLVAEPLPTG